MPKKLSLEDIKYHGGQVMSRMNELKITSRNEVFGSLKTNRNKVAKLSLDEKRKIMQFLALTHRLNCMPMLGLIQSIALTVLGDGLGQEISSRFCLEIMSLSKSQSASILFLTGDNESNGMVVSYIGELSKAESTQRLLLGRGNSQDFTLRDFGPTLSDWSAEHKGKGVVFDTNGLGNVHGNLKILGIKSFINTTHLINYLDLIWYNSIRLANLLNNYLLSVVNTHCNVRNFSDEISIYFRLNPKKEEKIKSLNQALGLSFGRMTGGRMSPCGISLFSQHVSIRKLWFFDQLSEKARHQIFDILDVPHDTLSIRDPFFRSP